MTLDLKKYQNRTTGNWTVKVDALRRSPCDPRLPDLYEVPVMCGNIVALVHSGHKAGEEGKEACLANAYLIADAPLILEALQKTQEECEEWKLKYIMETDYYPAEIQAERIFQFISKYPQNAYGKIIAHRAKAPENLP